MRVGNRRFQFREGLGLEARGIGKMGEEFGAQGVRIIKRARWTEHDRVKPIGRHGGDIDPVHRRATHDADRRHRFLSREGAKNSHGIGPRSILVFYQNWIATAALAGTTNIPQRHFIRVGLLDDA